MFKAAHNKCDKDNIWCCNDGRTVMFIKLLIKVKVIFQRALVVILPLFITIFVSSQEMIRTEVPLLS